MSVIILTPVGRLVGGHPLNQNAVTDNRGLPKMQADGVTPRTEAYVAIAIVKGPEAAAGPLGWQQTPWGQQIVAEAKAGWPNGEFNAPAFAWKIDDGDSQVPNTKGKKPADREGYPGHWVLKCSTGLAIKAFHAGRYSDLEQISNKNEIKPGDYCRININCKANNPSESPGVYLNPNMFELSRAGIQIQLGDGPDAKEAFGGSAPVLPAGAQVDTAVAGAAPAPAIPGAAPAPAPAPAITAAPDFLNGGAAEVMYTIPAGTQHTKAALLTAGWQAAAVDALPNTGAAAAAPAPPANTAPLPPVLFTIPAGTQHTKEALLTAGWLEAQIIALPNDGIPY